MRVFKFGGASVQNIERVKRMAGIVGEAAKEKDLLVIVSAMGKTTNALEKVAEAFFEGNNSLALNLFDEVKRQHIDKAKYLLVTHFNACLSHMEEFVTEVAWLLHNKAERGYDYYYDQIVCIGEMLSTCIISHYLNESGIANTWLDVRDVLFTDDNFRDANIDWKKSGETTAVAMPKGRGRLYVTQGFVGSTSENESTTLGREGSDYTAAIFANLLEAESLTIWKDVAGVMNADPKAFPEAVIINDLSFAETIEMAYYGAQVIHPKTIKPLHNKKIPLFVKCFLDTSLPGTKIHDKKSRNLPPMFVEKKEQVLFQMSSQDYSFVGEEPLTELYGMFKKIKIRPNLVQTGAIGLYVCVDGIGHSNKVEQLAEAASAIFDVSITKGLSLLTVRHYNEPLIQRLLEGKETILVQKTPETFQALLKAGS